MNPRSSEPEEAIAVRPASPDDVPALIDFQLRLARESEGLALAPEVLRQGVLGVFADPARGRYWVAEAEGRVVGCLLTTREWSDWRAGTIAWVQSVYVVPEAWRRGVYRRLYERLRREVESSPDLKGIRLCVDKTNAPAQRAYERLGMTRGHYDLYEWLKNLKANLCLAVRGAPEIHRPSGQHLESMPEEFPPKAPCAAAPKG